MITRDDNGYAEYTDILLNNATKLDYKNGWLYEEIYILHGAGHLGEKESTYYAKLDNNDGRNCVTNYI
jgi:hypothetical protein